MTFLFFYGCGIFHHTSSSASSNSSSSTAPVSSKSISTSPKHIDTANNNTIAFSWNRIAGNKFSKILCPVKFSLADSSNPESIAKELKIMPKGYRALRIWDTWKLMTENPKDSFTVTHGNGSKEKIPSPIWQNGVKKCEKFHNTIFSYLSNRNIEIDFLIIDMEVYYSNWTINSIGGNDSYLPVYYRELKRNGLINIIIDADKIINRSEYPDEYLQWNKIAKELSINYLNQGIYNVFKKYYPNAECSNYAVYLNKDTLPVPEINGHKDYKFPINTVVGTHQSNSFYGRLGQIATTNKPDNANNFDTTAYCAFLYEYYKFVSMKTGSNVPVHPWIANRSFSEFQNNKRVTFLTNSDYYQEMIYHLLCLGTDIFLYWNSPANDSDATILNNIITDFDNLQGNKTESNYSTSPVNIDWNRKYVFSVNSKRNDWGRFTPRLDPLDSIQSKILTTNPATFKIGNDTIVINNYYIPNRKSYSSKGIWLKRK